MKIEKSVLRERGKELLTQDGLNGIRWPAPETQRAYTGADGEVLLGRTVDFVEKLASVVPSLESDQWRGLDYGVGFGRIASLLSLFGSASQLTCVDAWQKSLNLARESGLMNPSFLVDASLKEGALPTGEYDFAYAYSIFTHLPDSIFVHNISRIVASLKPGGVFVFTVREPKFIDFLKRSNKFNPVRDELETAGYWFGNAQSADYGDTVVTSDWIQKHLSGFGSIEMLGVLPSEPFQHIVRLQRT
jgi:SAM-dependent methyltransferase